MDYEIWFKLVNLSVMPAWALLVFAPKWKGTEKIVHTAFFPLMFGLAYIYFLSWGIVFGGSVEGAGMSTLAKVMLLFDSPVSMLAGWIHYLVFDLFIGAWIARDAQRHDFAHIFVVPCLLLCFIFGPIGLFLYMVLCWVKGKGFSLREG
ncbi:MAG: hypothetical protein COA43_04040 [Robiginitomaculum sp.]|nr:MAG: hypothetical protein COA43_04040 [Robiginitomaculum sp.]